MCDFLLEIAISETEIQKLQQLAATECPQIMLKSGEKNVPKIGLKNRTVTQLM
jgi:hypothetical protein